MNEKEPEDMVKYGVKLDDQKTKLAQKGDKGTHCPICLEELDNAGACPIHGTEPFEPNGH